MLIYNNFVLHIVIYYLIKIFVEPVVVMDLVCDDLMPNEKEKGNESYEKSDKE